MQVLGNSFPKDPQVFSFPETKHDKSVGIIHGLIEAKSHGVRVGVLKMSNPGQQGYS